MKRGFTLIELSIVLVIIGLVVGGVLVGKDMIKAADRRAMIGDLQAISTSFNTFRTKYNCMPGDCPNATTFFGKNTTLCNGHSGSAGSPGTCNGNGNRRVLEAIASSTTQEGYEALKQLMMAEFIPHTATTPALPPVVLKWFDLNLIAWDKTLSGKRGHYMRASTYSTNGIINCQELLSLDQSYDDGFPHTGRILLSPESPHLNTCTDVGVTTYDPSHTSPLPDQVHFYYLLD